MTNYSLEIGNSSCIRASSSGAWIPYGRLYKRLRICLVYKRLRICLVSLLSLLVAPSSTIVLVKQDRAEISVTFSTKLAGS